MTVRLDEELKRQEKLKRHRDKRAARRPRKTVPAITGATSMPPVSSEPAPVPPTA
jgi:hypothetical protein